MNGLTNWLATDGTVWGPAMVLCAALIGGGLAHWAGRERAGHRQGANERAANERAANERAGQAPSDPRALQLTRRGTWLLALWLVSGLAIFAAIVSGLRDPAGPLSQFDTAVAQGLAASLPRPFLGGVAMFTRLGDRSFLMGVSAVVLILLLWHRRWALTFTWVVAAAGGGTLNTVLKSLFMRVRPDHAHGFLEASGFSFPSGHATGAVAVYGMLAYVLARSIPERHHVALFSLACALIAGIGISRVLLHVHFVSDVLAGWAVTSAWIAFCVLIHNRTQQGTIGPRP